MNASIESAKAMSETEFDLKNLSKKILNSPKTDEDDPEGLENGQEILDIQLSDIWEFVDGYLKFNECKDKKDKNKFRFLGDYGSSLMLNWKKYIQTNPNSDNSFSMLWADAKWNEKTKTRENVQWIYLWWEDENGKRNGYWVEFQSSWVKRWQWNHGRFVWVEDYGDNSSYNWERDEFNKKNWYWVYTWSNWCKYEWERKNGEMSWHWIYTWPDWYRYDWEWKWGERNWKGKFYDINWNLVYDWPWVDGKMTTNLDNDEMWIYYYYKNNVLIWKYEWKFIDDERNWQWTYVEYGSQTNKQIWNINKYLSGKYREWKNNDKDLNKQKGRRVWRREKWKFVEWIWFERDSWKKGYYAWSFVDGVSLDVLYNNEEKRNRTDADIERNGAFFYDDGLRSEEYMLNSWELEIKSRSNDFVYLYGDAANDKKPWSNYAKFRWPITYSKAKILNKENASQEYAKYSLESWDNRTVRTLDKWYFNFYKGCTSDGKPVWNPLKIKKGAVYNWYSFWERDAQHVANLLNFFKNKKDLNWYDWFCPAPDNSLRWGKIKNTTPSSGWGSMPGRSEVIFAKELNMLNNVPKHFFWDNAAYEVAKLLNDDDTNNFLLRNGYYAKFL